MSTKYYPVIWLYGASEEKAQKVAKKLGIDAALLTGEDSSRYLAELASDLCQEGPVVIASKSVTRPERITANGICNPIWVAVGVSPLSNDDLRFREGSNYLQYKRAVRDEVTRRIVSGDQYKGLNKTGLFN